MNLTKNIAVIAGDGIGPEITSQAIRVLNTIADKFGHSFKFNFIKTEKKSKIISE